MPRPPEYIENAAFLIQIGGDCRERRIADWFRFWRDNWEFDFPLPPAPRGFHPAIFPEFLAQPEHP